VCLSRCRRGRRRLVVLRRKSLRSDRRRRRRPAEGAAVAVTTRWPTMSALVKATDAKDELVTQSLTK